METESLAICTAKLVEEHGVPRVLDVERSIRTNKPILSGAHSPASFYIRPPDGMTADAFVSWFESVPGFPEFKLTLVPILGLDTYHQPLISSDDFARKYFRDNQERIVRVVGKSDHAIASMAAFVDALKRPFDAALFPNHHDFLVSGYRPGEEGRSIEVKLLFKVANPNLLMKIERLVKVHLDECNLGGEIVTSRHLTANHPPELILTSTSDSAFAASYLDALVASLPRAKPEEIAKATEAARASSGSPASPTPLKTRFAQAQVPSQAPSSVDLQKAALASLADVLKGARFGGSEIAVVQGGGMIEAKFPRSASTLWIMTSFREGKHIRELSSYCIGVKANPALREGWSAIYHYDGGGGTLQIRAVATGSTPPDGWKTVPG